MMPEKIWARESPNGTGSERWWAERQFKPGQVEYVRADLHERVKEERDALYEALKVLLEQCEEDDEFPDDVKNRGNQKVMGQAQRALAKVRGEEEK